MFNKLFLICFLFLSSFDLIAEEKVLTVEVTVNSEERAFEFDLITWQGMKKALSTEINNQATDEAFWKKIEEKRALDKLSLKDSIELLKGLFHSSVLEMPAPLDIKEKSVDKTEVITARFKYDLNSVKLKQLTMQLLSDLPDVSLKTLYILANIDIDDSLNWEDVGVTRAESFSGVIKESWKKLAISSIKGFDQYVIINKDLGAIEGINPKSVVLKWKSQLKKTFHDKDQKSARFELTAQYVLTNAKTDENLLAFDFPVQKREYSMANPKTLSSALASMIYNLLNAQTSKISSALTQALAAQSLQVVEYKISSNHGLSELYQAIAWLNENFKEKSLVVELKSYSNPGSTIVVKSNESAERINEIISAKGTRFSFNEQKILVFNPADKSFAIILKDGNN